MKTTQSHGRMITDRGEIDLAVLGRVIWNRIWLVLLAAIFMATLAGVLTKVFIAPTYESNFTAFVNNRTDVNTQNGYTYSDASASESLAHTYAEIVTSRPMLEQAAKKAGIDKTYAQLKGMVSTNIQTDTQLVNIHVVAGSSKEAYKLAKAISEIAPGYLSDVVEGTSMKVVAAPVENPNKVGPSMKRNGMIGAMLGILIAIAIILILELTDTRVKSSQELEDRYGYSVVGMIPTFDSFGKDNK